ncbi:kinase-like domain-containing protein [Parachaetomium inaequale]|uniref:Kinase-like domain-containing protein n=1 Tax=Parachaetomium inaequale TaxID=2588326 RepID=A0AAN6PK45_9PEZI|nr:kinase-like domain-containing protein [Parachaetomium inaequale]
MSVVDAIGLWFHHAARWARSWYSTEPLAVELLPRTYNETKLLNDTVTEVLITCGGDKSQGLKLQYKQQPEAGSEYVSVVSSLWAYTREDLLRVRFPPYHGNSGTPAKDLSEITDREELHGVFTGEVLDQELHNLQLLDGSVAGIVQLVAAVVSTNPYQTAALGAGSDSVVLRGLLLEYHPNGTLQDALDAAKTETDWHWCQWGLQITKALAHLHQCGLTHMDLKPSNVVISADMRAILVDLSGIGGVTREWLSPEMRITAISSHRASRLESKTIFGHWAKCYQRWRMLVATRRGSYWGASPRLQLKLSHRVFF